MINELNNDFMYQTDLEIQPCSPCLSKTRGKKPSKHYRQLSPNRVILELSQQERPVFPVKAPKLLSHRAKLSLNELSKPFKKLKFVFKNPLIQVNFPAIHHSPVLKPSVPRYSRVSQLTPIQPRPFKYSVILENFYLSSTT